MDEEVKLLDKEKDFIITEEHEGTGEKKHGESKLLMEEENMGVEDDVTDTGGHVFEGEVEPVDVKRTEEGSSLPETVEVVKQGESSSWDPEKMGTSKITTKDTEIKCVATEEQLVRQKPLQNENIKIFNQTVVSSEKRMMEGNTVLQKLGGALAKVESSSENTVPLERDDSVVAEDVEMDCSGEENTNVNDTFSEVGTLVAHELEDKSQINVSTKSVDEEMIELKDDVTGTVTTDASIGKVEIEIEIAPPDGGLGSLSKALSEVETGADGGTVAGMGSLVEYSSSDDEDSVDSSASSSSSSSTTSSSDSDSDDNTSSGRKVEEEVVNKKEEEMKDKDDGGEDKDADEDKDGEEEAKTGPSPPLKTKKEVMLQDLPEVPYVEFRLADGEEINLLGKISSIIGQLVVVASNRDTPALNEDTVLFKENRHPIGVVFETFGPVSNPFYTVRFNSTKDISDLELTLNADIFFAPRREEITNYVFLKQLRAMKGSDASWINDEEPPVECLDFSDDEAEKFSKKKKVLEDGKRKRVRRRDDFSSHDNTTSQGITGQQTSFNARNNHNQYGSRGGHSRGPYHSSMQRPRAPFNTRTNHGPGQRPLYGHNAYRQHGDNNWSQQQGHMFPPRVPFDGQNIQPFHSNQNQPFDPNFGYNPNFPRTMPPPPFQNQGLPRGDGPVPWQPRPPQHFTGTPHPFAPPAMSAYSVPPPPFMSLGPLNPTSAPIGMVPPPPPPGPPP